MASTLPYNLLTVRDELLGLFGAPAHHSIDELCRIANEPSEALIARACLTIQKPYGANHVLVLKRGYGISFARLSPGQGTSLHYHVERREVFLVRAGNLVLIHGDSRRHLLPGDVGASEPGTPHSLLNDGDLPVHVLELFSPPLLADKVRVADRYGRSLGPVGVHE